MTLTSSGPAWPDSPCHSTALRDLGEPDLPAAWALSNALQWPHRLADWQAFLQLGEGRAAIHGQDLAAVGMRWAWGEQAVSIGVVIVASAWRGQGWGRRMMQALAQGLDDRALMLNATEEGRPLYEKLGYEPVGTVHQHQGLARQAAGAALPHGWHLRQARPGEAPSLAVLDEAARGFPRGRLIAHCLAEAVQAVVLEDSRGACGFAAMRRFGRGLVIGPVVAPDRVLAQALINRLLGSVAGQFVRIDLPGDPVMAGWLADRGLSQVGVTTAMVRGRPPRGDGVLFGHALVAQALG